jgi:hypothetical protein
LRAEWGQLDNPARIEALAKHFLPLKPIAPTQFDSLDQLPDRPPQLVPPDSPDPIGAAIERLEEPERISASVPAPPPNSENDAKAGAAESDLPAVKSGRLDR